MNTDQSPIARLGGRKFVVALLSIAGIHAMLAWGLINATIYRDLMLGIAAVYVAGNVTQKATAKAAT